MNRKTLVSGAVAIAVGTVLLIGGLVMYQFVWPSLITKVEVTGVPTAQGGGLRATLTARAQTTTPTVTGRATPQDSDLRVAYTGDKPLKTNFQQQGQLYEPCIAVRGATATPSDSPAPAPTATATPDAGTPGPSDIKIFRIVKEESEACFQIGEILRGQYVLAVGVTKTIDGEIAIDLGNISASLLGDEIVVNIAELVTDQPQRNRWIISPQGFNFNQFPFARFTEATIEGLPTRPYVEGETLSFTITGKMQIRETVKETTFNARGMLKEGTLVVTAYADILLRDYGLEPPNLGFVRANNEARIVLNLVAREE